MAVQDKKPLIAYLRIQKDYERQLIKILERAARENARAIRDLAGKDGIGAKVRADQLREAQRAIRKKQAELWRSLGNLTEAGRKEAAAKAVQTSFSYSNVLLEAVTDPATRAALQKAAEAAAQRGLDALIAKVTGLSDYELSANVYRAQALSTGQLNALISSKIASGTSWRELAQAVRGSILPNTPGGVSYAAKRLARTELNNAFHAVSVQEGIESPFIVGQKWNLSGSHPVPDECNQYAEQAHYTGGEAGVYKPENVPAKPHPQCLCFLTPETPSNEEFMRNFLLGKYDSYLSRVAGV